MALSFPRLRFNLRTLLVLVACCALSTWVMLFFLSPTWRFARQLQASQPATARREAAIALGYHIPPWERNRAIRLLVNAMNDPSPRVRECAAAGLSAHGRAAEHTAPQLVALLGDRDSGVRFSAAAALGLVIGSEGNGHAIAVPGLLRTLQDPKSEVRLSAALSLFDNGEVQAATQTFASIMGGKEAHLRSRVESLKPRLMGKALVLIPGLIQMTSDEDPQTRKGALELLLQLAPPSIVRAAFRRACDDKDADIRAWALEKFSHLAPAASASEPNDD